MDLLGRAMYELGVLGLLVVAFIAFLSLTLTQVVKMVVRSVQRKAFRREQARREAVGQAPLDANELELFGGLGVVAVSCFIGGALGAALLGPLAERVGADSGPLSGALLGLMLGGSVSGYVNYRQQQVNANAKAQVLTAASLPAAVPASATAPMVDLSELVGVLAQLRVPAGPSPWDTGAAQPQSPATHLSPADSLPASPGSIPGPGPASEPEPELADPRLPYGYRTITPDEVRKSDIDWPATPATDNANWRP